MWNKSFLFVRNDDKFQITVCACVFNCLFSISICKHKYMCVHKGQSKRKRKKFKKKRKDDKYLNNFERELNKCSDSYVKILILSKIRSWIKKNVCQS